MSNAKAEAIQNDRNNFETYLGSEVEWLAKEMSQPSVGIMTKTECEDINTRGLLGPAQQRRLIVDALVRALEQDEDGEYLKQFLIILNKKPAQYRTAIRILGAGGPSSSSSSNSSSATQGVSGSATFTYKVVKNKDIQFLMKKMKNYSYKYQDIGLGLKFSLGEIRGIEKANPRGTPQDFLTEILDQWTLWPNEDHPDDPTLEKLCEVLNSGLVGLGALSRDIYELKDSLPSMKTEAATPNSTISAATSIKGTVFVDSAVPKNAGAVLQPDVEIQHMKSTVLADSAVPKNSDAVLQPDQHEEGFVEIQQVKGEFKGEEVDGNTKKRRRIGKRSLFTAKPEILWRGYKELRVFFMNNDKKYMLDGFSDDAAHNQIILDWMNEWRRSENSFVPKFRLVQDKKDSDVRVKYGPALETSIGMEANDDKVGVSMELSLKYVHESLKDRAPIYASNYKKYNVLHETGHALGFYHEHQYPIFNGDVFERDIVLADLKKEYNLKGKKAIDYYDANFGPEPDPGFTYSFDCDSIMRYPYVVVNQLNIVKTIRANSIICKKNHH